MALWELKTIEICVENLHIVGFVLTFRLWSLPIFRDFWNTRYYRKVLYFICKYAFYCKDVTFQSNLYSWFYDSNGDILRNLKKNTIFSWKKYNPLLEHSQEHIYIGIMSIMSLFVSPNFMYLCRISLFRRIYQITVDLLEFKKVIFLKFLY